MSPARCEGPRGSGQSFSHTKASSSTADEEADVTTPTKSGSGEGQANRLERVHEEVAKLLREPGVASRLRTPPGANEWSPMQTLGHLTEMIPHWLKHCQTLITATRPP